jgi:hypothetical protein
METNTYDAIIGGVNPFVRSALDIVLEHAEGSCPLPELAALLADREPMLSPFNLECAAREALRREADCRAALEKAALLARQWEAEEAPIAA